MKNESNLTLPILEILKKTFLEVDAEIIKNFNALPTRDSGSTAVVAFLEVKNRGAGDGEVGTQGLNAIEPDRHRVLYCANAGDSRGVLCRGGKSIPLTEDHRISKDNTTENERIEQIFGKGKDIIIQKGRVCGVLNLTRSLGDCDYKRLVIAEPYTREEKLGDEDEFVILASDGVSYTKHAALARLTHLTFLFQLWDKVENEQAVEHVRYTKDPEKAAEELVKLATDGGSRDNITVVVIRLRDPPARDCQNPHEPDMSD